MRFANGIIATVASVILLAAGTASFSLDGASGIAAGALGAGFGTLFVGWHLLSEHPKGDA